MVFPALLKDKNDFVELCKKYRVKHMFVFGSAATPQFDQSKSDIDLIADLLISDPIEYGETLLELWDALENYFGRKVDLLTEESITNPYLKRSIEVSKKMIYDGQREEVFV
jgi:uncharacterized protein